jgi:hypothetical protein
MFLTGNGIAVVFMVLVIVGDGLGVVVFIALLIVLPIVCTTNMVSPHMETTRFAPSFLFSFATTYNRSYPVRTR